MDSGNSVTRQFVPQSVPQLLNGLRCADLNDRLSTPSYDPRSGVEDNLPDTAPMDQGAPPRGAGHAAWRPVPALPPTTTAPGSHEHPAPADELASDRPVSPVPLPPDCPATTARVKSAYGVAARSSKLDS
jgi:hypothetical protein